MTDITALLAKAPSDVKEQALLADDEARIAAALAREHITLDKAVAQNENYFLRLLEFARSNEHCTFHCPGRAACDHVVKGYTAKVDAHGYVSYAPCQAGKAYEDVFSSAELKEAARIPALYRAMTFANYDCNEMNRDALAYGKTLSTGTSGGRGLFLIGPTGVGKTHLAVAILQAWVQNNRSGAFCTVPLLMERLRECVHSHERKSRYLESLAKVDLLVLDDFGAEHDTDWVREQLLLIIDARYAEGKPMVITSNLTMEEFEAEGGIASQRICSRLAGSCEVFLLDGEDRRTMSPCQESCNMAPLC